MVQRKALLEGQELASRLGDTKSAEIYGMEAQKVSESLDSHWDDRRRFIRSSLKSSRPGRSGLDSSVILGVIHTEGDSDQSSNSFGPNDEYAFILHDNETNY